MNKGFSRHINDVSFKTSSPTIPKNLVCTRLVANHFQDTMNPRILPVIWLRLHTKYQTPTPMELLVRQVRNCNVEYECQGSREFIHLFGGLLFRNQFQELVCLWVSGPWWITLWCKVSLTWFYLFWCDVCDFRWIPKIFNALRGKVSVKYTLWSSSTLMYSCCFLFNALSFTWCFSIVQ